MIMVAAESSEMSVNFYQSAQHYNNQIAVFIQWVVCTIYRTHILMIFKNMNF